MCPLTALCGQVGHQDEVVGVTGGVLAAGAAHRLLRQLQVVGWTQRGGRQGVLGQGLHVREGLDGGSRWGRSVRMQHFEEVEGRGRAREETEGRKCGGEEARRGLGFDLAAGKCN